MDKKLKSLSTTMKAIIQLLALSLPLLIIFSWLFPTNAFSINAYLGTTIGGSIQGDFNTALQQFRWNNKLLGIAGGLISLLPLWLGFLALIKLFNNYAHGVIFTQHNAKIYGRLGLLCLLSALIFQPLSGALYVLAVTINYPVGQRILSIGVSNTNLTAIICGLFLIIVARVMRIAHQINEEQQLTI